MFRAMFDNYIQYEHLLAQVQLALFMLGMGATLSWKDFLPVIKQPRDLFLGLLCVLGIGPLIAIVLPQIFSVDKGIAMGLLLVGTLPGGSLSNVFTWLARGNAALSIALSGCGAILCLFTLPLTLQLLAGQYVPADFQMPVWGIIREIILFVLIPLGLGMLLALRISQETAIRFSKWVIRFGFVLVLYMIAGSLVSDRVELGDYGWGPPLLILLYCLLIQQLSILPLRFRWPPENFVAIGLEVTIRNVYLGILLVTVLFPAKAGVLPEMGGHVLFVVLFYGAASMGCGLPLAMRIRRKLKT